MQDSFRLPSAVLLMIAMMAGLLTALPAQTAARGDSGSEPQRELALSHEGRGPYYLQVTISRGKVRIHRDRESFEPLSFTLHQHATRPIYFTGRDYYRTSGRRSTGIWVAFDQENFYFDVSPENWTGDFRYEDQALVIPLDTSWYHGVQYGPINLGTDSQSWAEGIFIHLLLRGPGPDHSRDSQGLKEPSHRSYSYRYRPYRDHSHRYSSSYRHYPNKHSPSYRDHSYKRKSYYPYKYSPYYRNHTHSYKRHSHHSYKKYIPYRHHSYKRHSYRSYTHRFSHRNHD